MKKIITEYPELMPAIDRTIYCYECNEISANSKAERWGVNRRKRVDKKLVLFSGTGRSGSKTMALLMQKVGLDVQHEMNGEHGTSTHFFHVDHDWYPMFPWYKGRAHVGERLSDFEYEHRIHMVRNPLTAIPSIAKIFGSIDTEFLRDLDLIPEECIKTPLWRCAYIYFSINNRLDRQGYDMRIQLEQLRRKGWPLLRERLGIEQVVMPDVHSNKGSGFRRSEPLINLNEVASYDRRLANNIAKMGRRYGYKI